MSLLTVFSEIKTLFTHLFVDSSKIVADAPKTIEATKVFWTASVPMIAALSVAFSDKGINIPADSAAFVEIKAWLTAAKIYSSVIEQDFKDFESSTATPPAVPVVEAPVTVVK